MKPRACCCGDMRWEHLDDGNGACRRCGPLSCPHFHEIGEGHPPLGFVASMAALIAFTLYGLWRTSTTHRALYGVGGLTGDSTTSTVWPSFNVTPLVQLASARPWWWWALAIGATALLVIALQVAAIFVLAYINQEDD